MVNTNVAPGVEDPSRPAGFGDGGGRAPIAPGVGEGRDAVSGAARAAANVAGAADLSLEISEEGVNIDVIGEALRAWAGRLIVSIEDKQAWADAWQAVQQKKAAVESACAIVANKQDPLNAVMMGALPGLEQQLVEAKVALAEARAVLDAHNEKLAKVDVNRLMTGNGTQRGLRALLRICEESLVVEAVRCTMPDDKGFECDQTSVVQQVKTAVTSNGMTELIQNLESALGDFVENATLQIDDKTGSVVGGESSSSMPVGVWLSSVEQKFVEWAGAAENKASEIMAPMLAGFFAKQEADRAREEAEREAAKKRAAISGEAERLSANGEALREGFVESFLAGLRAYECYLGSLVERVNSAEGAAADVDSLRGDSPFRPHIVDGDDYGEGVLVDEAFQRNIANGLIAIRLNGQKSARIEESGMMEMFDDDEVRALNDEAWKSLDAFVASCKSRPAVVSAYERCVDAEKRLIDSVRAGKGVAEVHQVLREAGNLRRHYLFCLASGFASYIGLEDDTRGDLLREAYERTKFSVADDILGRVLEEVGSVKELVELLSERERGATVKELVPALERLVAAKRGDFESLRDALAASQAALEAKQAQLDAEQARGRALEQGKAELVSQLEAARRVPAVTVTEEPEPVKRSGFGVALAVAAALGVGVVGYVAGANKDELAGTLNGLFAEDSEPAEVDGLPANEWYPVQGSANGTRFEINSGGDELRQLIASGSNWDALVVGCYGGYVSGTYSVLDVAEPAVLAGLFEGKTVEGLCGQSDGYFGHAVQVPSVE